MPRGPRLDAPGILHHVMARGIENTPIFRTREDREDFLHRLAGQVETSDAQVLAWALLPNHFHLLLRTGRRPLSSLIRRVLTGYAGAFNRRYKRHGHLFQNRYKSIVVEEEAYLLELTRYIHLNPLRAGLVRSVSALGRYPWSGHSALLGRVARPWQAVDVILGQFAATRSAARRGYHAFIVAGMRQGRRPELQGGGLHRSAGGWTALNDLRRGRERWAFDERILGSSAFVESVRREVRPPPRPVGRETAGRILPQLIEELADIFGVSAGELIQGSRRRPVTQARAAVSAVAVAHLGLPATQVAGALGVTLMAVLRGVERGHRYLHRRRLASDRLVRELLKKIL